MEIVREGFYVAEDFISVLGYRPEVAISQNTPICPGQLYRHYAPKASLTLTKEIPKTFEGVILGYKERLYPSKVFFLGSLNDPLEVAANLYHLLRQLDEEKVAAALVDMDIPSSGLWATIRERLQRASH